jgi:flavodoxin
LERNKKMKVLVAFYSRHGHTEKVATDVAKILKADIEKLEDTKDRSHLISWSKSAFDEELRTPTKISPLRKNPKDYDLVIIGTPIWDGITPPVHAYLSENNFKKVAFFVTFGAAADNSLYYMGKLVGKNPVASLELQDRQIDIGEDKKLIKDYCNVIARSLR